LYEIADGMFWRRYSLRRRLENSGRMELRMEWSEEIFCEEEV